MVGSNVRESVGRGVGMFVPVGDGVLVAVGTGVSVSSNWRNGASLRALDPAEGAR